MFKSIVLLLCVGAFIVIFVTQPLQHISLEINKVSNELNEANNNFGKLTDIQVGFANMGKSLDDTNKELKALNKKIGKSRLLRF